MKEKYKGTVIIVDDDPFVLSTTSLLLTKNGYNTISCSKAIEAIDILQKDMIDVVLADIMMPEMSGIELLEKIRNIHPDMPVILVTGFADLNKAIEAIKKGAFDFITKPYESSYLIHSIEKAVNYHRLLKREDDYKHILEELNAEIETLIAERTMALMSMAVADKIRNPVTMIAWACKRIIEKEKITDNLMEGFQIILKEAERLEHIVKEFQELFKTREIRFKYEDIRDVIKDVVSVAKIEAHTKDIDIDMDISEEPLKMNIEDKLMKMALLHLVRNAIEFTPVSGKILLKAYKEKEKIALEVSDTGVGTKKGFRKNI